MWGLVTESRLLCAVKRGGSEGDEGQEIIPVT